MFALRQSAQICRNRKNHIAAKPLNGLAQTAFSMYKKLIVGKITPDW